MKILKLNLSDGLIRATYIFLASLFVGIIMGLIFYQEELIYPVQIVFGMRDFIDIVTRNAIVLILIYVSMVFTKYYAYFVYAINGLVLGVVISWIIQSDLMLLLLILPHGVFEMPLLLHTSHHIEKGELYIRENMCQYFKDISIHLLLVIICAVIEVYITPRVYNLFI